MTNGFHEGAAQPPPYPGPPPSGPPGPPPGYPAARPESSPPAYPAPVPPTDAHPSPPPGLDEHGKVKRGKVSAIWVGLIVAAVLLIALLIFIAQNSRTVAIHFLGFAGHISLAVAILVAAVSGVLLVAIPGTARIVQLRRALKKNA